MTDQLLDILKIAFLALLYLFFMRVLWVVSSEVRAGRSASPANLAVAPPPTSAAPRPAAGNAPKAPKAPKGRRGVVARLVIIEPKARRGSSYAVGPEITLGRSPGCTVQIGDDAFVSNLHARVFVAEGSVVVEDVGSTNGTYLNGDRLQQPRRINKGDRLQVGQTVLEAQ